MRKLSLRANVLVTRGPYIDRARQYILSELENRSLAFREPWLDEGDNVQQKHQLSVTARPFSRRNDAAKTYICLLGDTSQSVSRHRTHIRQPKCPALSRFHHANRYFDMRALQHTTSRCREVATLALRVLWRIKLMGGSSQVINIGIYHTIAFIHVHNRPLLPLPEALGNPISSNAYVQSIRRQRLCRGGWS